MFTQLSLTSTTFLGFAFLLVTSCHCSFSLSSNRHHACIFVFTHFCTDVSFVFFNRVQTPVPTRLHAICRNVSCFPTAPANSGLTFATFLLPPVLDHSSFPTRFAPFSPLPLLKHVCRGVNGHKHCTEHEMAVDAEMLHRHLVFPIVRQRLKETCVLIVRHFTRRSQQKELVLPELLRLVRFFMCLDTAASWIRVEAKKKSRHQC